MRPIKGISLITGLLFSILIFESCSITSNKDPLAIYQVTALTNKAYTFNGNDLTDVENPELTLKRGETYLFEVDAFKHNFFIKTEQKTGSNSVYNDGVENNGIDSGTITFSVPTDAPDTLFYICKYHKMMFGKLIIVD